MSRLCSSLLLSLLIASSASAVTMDWTPIGNPGNACDPQSQGCFGAVGYAYSIGTYEVTNAQYAEFLNAKAASDPLELYNGGMSEVLLRGGIMRSGASGSFTYSVIAGRGDMPVNFVGLFDTLRFANWLNNGQGSGDTETGSYTLLGGTPTPSNGSTVTRNAGAAIFLPSEDEWYKAAYHNGLGLQATDYFDYPAGSDAPTTCSSPTGAANHANCDPNGYPAPPPDITVVGSYTGSASPYGTFDQGGNLWEVNETIIGVGSNRSRGERGGSIFAGSSPLAASARFEHDPELEDEDFGDHGFRLAMIPEPGTGLLVIAGLFGLSGWRRARPRGGHQ